MNVRRGKQCKQFEKISNNQEKKKICKKTKNTTYLFKNKTNFTSDNLNKMQSNNKEKHSLVPVSPLHGHLQQASQVSQLKEKT